MAIHRSSIATRAIPAGIALLVFAAFLLAPLAQANDELERAQLASLMRQLDLLDRTARLSETLADAESARYHLDYARLRSDIERIRSGIRGYLTPSRAQPRDAADLSGDYRKEREASTDRAAAP